MTPIAIIGLAGRFPDADDVEQLHLNLQRAHVSLRPISGARVVATTLDPDGRYRVMGYLDAIDAFDHAFFGMAMGEAMTLSPTARLLLEEAWHAFESSGSPAARFRGSRTDVYMTQTDSVYGDLADTETASLFTGNSPDFIVARLNRQFDLRGNAVIVDTSCSSGVAAVLAACDALRLERADYALVCGANLQLFPYDRPGLLDTWSPDGRSRSYAAEANGMVPGETAVCLLLTPLARAEAEGHVIHAVIRGGALNNNGAVSNSPSAPHSAMQAQAMREAWTQAGIAPRELGFIEGHGSGTQLGDSLEIEAFRIAFGDDRRGEPPCALSSIKANIGHGKSAAGLSSVVKAALAVRRGVLYPAPHAKQVNIVLQKPDSPVAVSTELAIWPEDRRIAAVHSFGMSGVNCHVVLENHRPAAPAVTDAETWFPAPISARTPEALSAQIAVLRDWLELPPEPSPWGNIAHTLCLGRQPFEQRWLTLARDASQLAQACGQWLETTPTAGQPHAGTIDPQGDGQHCTRSSTAAIAAPPRIVLLLSDDGEASAPAIERMSAQLASRFPAFRRAIARHGGEDERQRGVAAVVACQLALYELLREMGVTGALAGIGVGKLVASAATGALSVDQVMRDAEAIAGEPPQDLESRLAKLVARQMEQGPTVFIQCGPESAVSRELRRQTASTSSLRVLAFGDDSIESLGEMAAEVFVRGGAVRFDPWFEACGTHPAALPGYRFARTHCWIRSTPKLVVSPAAAAEPEAMTWERRWAQASVWERTVAAIWRDLLGQDGFGAEANLFDLGADSLLATRIVRRINQVFDIRCDFEDIFDAPTVAGLARLVRAQASVTQTLLAMWRDVLKNEAVGEQDDFFDLGGHSLLASEILLRIRRDFDLTLSFEDFFAAPTPSTLARLIETRLAARAGEPGAPAREAAAETGAVTPARQDRPLTPEAWAATLRRREAY